MRLKTEIWVKAYVRQCAGLAVPAAIVRKGHADAGAIFIKVNRLNGTVLLFAPAPTGLDEAALHRQWSPGLGGKPVSDAEADAYLTRQIEFDPDLWVVEIEDREGRHFLGDQLLAT